MWISICNSQADAVEHLEKDKLDEEREHSPPHAFVVWENGLTPSQKCQSRQNKQWMLKEALFHVTHFYSTGTVDRKEVEGSSCAVIDNNASDEKRGLGAVSQQQQQQQVGVQGGEETNGSHVLAERRRREKLNDRFMTLRALVPFVTKVRSYLCSNANAYC